MVGSSDSYCSGERGGRCVHRNRCLRVKAVFAGSAKLPANTAFAARAAIKAMAAAVVAVEAVEAVEGEAVERLSLVGRGERCCVVMGAIRKRFYRETIFTGGNAEEHQIHQGKIKLNCCIPLPVMYRVLSASVVFDCIPQFRHSARFPSSLPLFDFCNLPSVSFSLRLALSNYSNIPADSLPASGCPGDTTT